MDLNYWVCLVYTYQNFLEPRWCFQFSTNSFWTLQNKWHFERYWKLSTVVNFCSNHLGETRERVWLHFKSNCRLRFSRKVPGKSITFWQNQWFWKIAKKNPKISKINDFVRDFWIFLTLISKIRADSSIPNELKEFLAFLPTNLNKNWQLWTVLNISRNSNFAVFTWIRSCALFTVTPYQPAVVDLLPKTLCVWKSALWTFWFKQSLHTVFLPTVQWFKPHWSFSRTNFTL